MIHTAKRVMLKLQLLASLDRSKAAPRATRASVLLILIHILIEVSFISVVPIEPQASASTVTLLCGSMRVRIPPSLLLLKDHSF